MEDIKVFKSKGYIYFTNRKVSREVHLTEAQVRELRGRVDHNVQRIVPRMNHAVGFVEWPPLNAGMFFLMADLMAGGYKAPLAALIAVRVMDAHLASPEVEQWAIVTTENGNVSTMPFGSIDFRTGFISGGRLAFALVVDLRLYSERVERALAAADAERERVLSHAN